MAYRSSTSRRRSRGSVPAWVSIVIVAVLILAVVFSAFLVRLGDRK